MSAQPQSAEIGHNQPPSDADIFSDRMREKYPEMFAFAERILGEEDKLPEIVNDDDKSGEVGDFVKQVQTAYKNLDNARSAEKEVYLEGGRRVDGFFKRYTDKLKDLKKKAEEINAVYLKKKEDEKRRAAEEEAARRREEAEAKLREAERLRQEAEEKRRIAEDEARKAAAEAARRQAEIEAKAEADRKAAQAEIDRLNRAKADQEKADAETKAALKDANERLKQVDRDARADLKEVKQETRAAEDAAHEIAKQAKQDERASNKTLDEAIRADKQAEKLDKLAGTSAANLARTRGEQGSLSTIRTEWVGTVTSRDELDIMALRQHFKDDDLQIALNSWVKANPGKQLRGAFIREETKAITR